MNKCPEVYEHKEFKSSYDPSNKRQEKEITKIKRLLKAESGHFQGEQLKHDLSSIKSFPRGSGSLKTLFVICKDCNKELIQPNCKFCKESSHSMNDGVLFFIEGMIRPIKNGASLYVVQKLLGHSSPEMTQRYAHLGSDQLKEEVNLLDDKRGQFFDLGHILVTRQNAPQKQEKVKHTTR